MAWIESHQDIREHPKTYDLMARLKIEKRDAVGLLHLLWWWAMDNALTGDIRQPNVAVARAVEWEGDADALVTALVESDWLERNDGSLVIHDWHHRAGAIVEKRLQRKALKEGEADKKRRPRGRRTAAERPTNGSENRPTVSLSVSESLPKEKDSTPLGFADFWKVYPKKLAKNDAEKTWEKLKPDQQTIRWMLSSIRKFKDTREWFEKEGKFVPYPATWLNGRRWEDHDAPKPPPPPPTVWKDAPPLSDERKRELDAAMARPSEKPLTAAS